MVRLLHVRGLRGHFEGHGAVVGPHGRRGTRRALPHTRVDSSGILWIQPCTTCQVSWQALCEGCIIWQLRWQALMRGALHAKKAGRLLGRSVHAPLYSTVPYMLFRVPCRLTVTGFPSPLLSSCSPSSPSLLHYPCRFLLPLPHPPPSPLLLSADTRGREPSDRSEDLRRAGQMEVLWATSVGFLLPAGRKEGAEVIGSRIAESSRKEGGGLSRGRTAKSIREEGAKASQG